jgi:hypothetical protein
MPACVATSTPSTLTPPPYSKKKNFPEVFAGQMAHWEEERFTNPQ